MEYWVHSSLYSTMIQIGFTHQYERVKPMCLALIENLRVANPHSILIAIPFFVFVSIYILSTSVHLQSRTLHVAHAAPSIPSTWNELRSFFPHSLTHPPYRLVRIALGRMEKPKRLRLSSLSRVKHIHSRI